MHRLDCTPCNLMFRTPDFLTVRNAETIRHAGSRFLTHPHLRRPESAFESSLMEFKLIPGSAVKRKKINARLTSNPSGLGHSVSIGNIFCITLKLIDDTSLSQAI